MICYLRRPRRSSCSRQTIGSRTSVTAGWRARRLWQSESNAGEDGHAERRLDAGGSGRGAAAISEPEGGDALAEPGAATSCFLSYPVFLFKCWKFLNLVYWAIFLSFILTQSNSLTSHYYACYSRSRTCAMEKYSVCVEGVSLNNQSIICDNVNASLRSAQSMLLMNVPNQSFNQQW